MIHAMTVFSAMVIATLALMENAVALTVVPALMMVSTVTEQKTVMKLVTSV